MAQWEAVWNHPIHIFVRYYVEQDRSKEVTEGLKELYCEGVPSRGRPSIHVLKNAMDATSS